jgi:hypothetical protein
LGRKLRVLDRSPLPADEVGEVLRVLQRGQARIARTVDRLASNNAMPSDSPD